MDTNKKFFTWKTISGCWRFLSLFLVLIFVFGFMGKMFESDFGKSKISLIETDYRGAKLSGELYYPAGTSSHDSLPAIVVAHGGANTYGTVKNIAQEFARRGFVVFSFSSYGQGLSEQPYYDDSDQGANGLNITKTPAGFYDAVNYVKSLKFVDPTRIGIVGHSMGSYRGDFTLLLDCQYFTLNDIMINVLYEEFGQTFTQSEIYEDADTLAKERLNDDQLAYYNELRKTKEADFNTRIKAMCVTGIDRSYANDPQTVKVGGYDVTRSIQTNLGFIDGEFDEFIFDFGTKDFNKAAWYSADKDLSRGEWYALDDQTSSSKIVGSIFKDTVRNNAELKDAIANRSARVFYTTKGEDHCKETISTNVDAAMTEFFSETLGYNCGNLSDSSTVPMNNYNTIFAGRVICNTITVLAFVGLLLALSNILVMSKSFVPERIDEGKFTRISLSKAHYWIYSAVMFLVAFFALHKANQNWYAVGFGMRHRLFTTNMIWPLAKPAAITFYYLMLVALGCLVCVAVSAVLMKRKKGNSGLAALNINIKFTSIMKYLALSLMLLVVGYVINGTLEYLFGEDLRIWQNAFSDVKPELWYVVLVYGLTTLPFMFLMSCGINYTVRTDIPEWKDTLITVVVNSAPIWLLWLITVIVVNSTAHFNGTFFCDFVCSYSFVGLIPIVTYINRKLYKMTNSIWLGTFVCSVLIAWDLVCTLGTGDFYYPQNIWSLLMGA